MTNKMKLAGVALVLVGAVVGALLAGSFGTKNVGGVYSQVEQTFGQGASFGTARQMTVSNAGALVTSGDVTTSSDFVSTKAGLCFNFYATSTATLGKMTASTTATIEGVDGVMMFAYGSCQS